MVVLTSVWERLASFPFGFGGGRIWKGRRLAFRSCGNYFRYSIFSGLFLHVHDIFVFYICSSNSAALSATYRAHAANCYYATIITTKTLLY